LNMPFNGKSNLQVALEDGKLVTMSRALDVLTREKALMSIVESEGIDNEDAKPLMQNAINQNNEEAIRFLLYMIKQERTSFQDVVHTMESCFQDLWIHYNNLTQPLIKHDALSKMICHVHLPSHLCQSVGHSSTIVRTTKRCHLSQWRIHARLD